MHTNKKTMFHVVFDIILVLAFLISVIIISSTTSHNNDIKTYNNGICSTCGGTYEFLTVVGHHATTNYVYKCKNCNELIEIGTYYKE